MAFVTSYIVPSKVGTRTRAVACYHGARPGDDAERSHSLHYTFHPNEPFLHVSELWQKYRWGRRGGKFPICPRHRQHGDDDFPKDP